MDPVTRQAATPERDEQTQMAERRDVRTRRTLSGDGAASTVMTVFCPEVARSASLDACSDCERCRRIAAEPGKREGSVLCAMPPQARWGPADGATAPRQTARATRWGATTRADEILPDRVPVRAIMTRDVVCVTEDVSAETFMSVLLDRGISGAPVVDAEGRPIGVVSKTDLVRDRYENGASQDMDYEVVRVARARGHAFDLGAGFHTEHLAGRTVGDLMTPLVLALPEGATVSRAAALMAYESVHRVPIVSDSGAVVGILAAVDVLRWLAISSGYALAAQAAVRPVDETD